MNTRTCYDLTGGIQVLETKCGNRTGCTVLDKDYRPLHLDPQGMRDLHAALSNILDKDNKPRQIRPLDRRLDAAEEVVQQLADRVQWLCEENGITDDEKIGGTT